MSTNIGKATRLILLSGILNCILGIVHQVILYFTYLDYANRVTADLAELVSDYLLFSMATGTVIFFIGLLTCYSYRGIIHGEKQSKTICAGISVLLFLFAIKIFAIFGFSHPIGYVHCFNSLLIALPLVFTKKQADISVTVTR